MAMKKSIGRTLADIDVAANTSVRIHGDFFNTHRRCHMNLPWDILIASADLEGRRALSNILAKLEVDPLTTSTICSTPQEPAKQKPESW